METEVLMYGGTAAIAIYGVTTILRYVLEHKLIKNQLVVNVLNRLSYSISAAVTVVEQTTKKELLKAKDPNSPGGVSITREEADALKSTVWLRLVKEYGGYKGLGRFLGQVDLKSEEEKKALVDNMIERSVNDLKKRTSK
jgi:hypothetical protein